jgi:RNA polymerase sigma-70 factor (ECF subfamily)
MDLTDQEYVERCRDGHPEDFDRLVDRYQRPLFAYLAARVGGFPQVEEAAQESFVRAFLSLKKLRQPASFYAWLLGIAGRVAKEQYRTEVQDRRNREAAEMLMTGDSGPGTDYPLEEALAALPEHQRQVILLRYYEGLSCQEAAARLQLPLGTVTKTLSRAYALLRQELGARERVETNLNPTEQP